MVVAVVAVGEALATYGERHMYLVSPLVWVLVSWAVVWLARTAQQRWPDRRPLVGWAVAAGAAAWVLVSLGYAVTLGAVPKTAIRAMVADERELLARDTTLVVLAPDYLESAYTYYLPGGPPAHGLAFWDEAPIEGGPVGLARRLARRRRGASRSTSSPRRPIPPRVSCLRISRDPTTTSICRTNEAGTCSPG